MKQFLILLPLIAYTACAQTPVEKVTKTIRPGEVRWIEFPIQDSKNALTCRGEEIKFAEQGNKGKAFIMESYFSNLKPFKCVVTSNGAPTYEINFKVENREYPAEQLRVDSKTIRLSPEAEKRAWEEQQVLNRIYASSERTFHFTQPFIPPLNSVVTSIYGTKRVYNKKKKGQHLGIDYRAAIGDKIPAANSGKVVFAGDLFYTGWTVILDHGMDIFTVYGHLSKTLVKEGEMVKRGQLIALSGNTGRTSGPHLHWGVKVQGQYIDGFVLVDETKKYFTE